MFTPHLGASTEEAQENVGIEIARNVRNYLVEGSIVMTEKDAIKCRDLGLENAWFLRVNAKLPRDFEADVVNRVRLQLESEAGGQG